MSPSGDLLSFIFNSCKTAIYYPDYEKKKIFVLKDDKKKEIKQIIFI
jgi:hypothetical protein